MSKDNLIKKFDQAQDSLVESSNALATALKQRNSLIGYFLAQLSDKTQEEHELFEELMIDEGYRKKHDKDSFFDGVDAAGSSTELESRAELKAIGYDLDNLTAAQALELCEIRDTFYQHVTIVENTTYDETIANLKNKISIVNLLK